MSRIRAKLNKSVDIVIHDTNSPKVFLLLTFLIMSLFIPILKAHIMISPSSTRAGSEEVYTVTVYGERPPPTIKIELFIPSDFRIIEVENISGWRYEISSNKSHLIIIWQGIVHYGWSINLRFRALNPNISGIYKFIGYQIYLDGNVTIWDWEGLWVEIKGGDSQHTIDQATQQSLWILVLFTILAALFIPILIVLIRRTRSRF
jgi:hypothetical protein